MRIWILSLGFVYSGCNLSDEGVRFQMGDSSRLDAKIEDTNQSSKRDVDPQSNDLGKTVDMEISDMQTSDMQPNDDVIDVARCGDSRVDDSEECDQENLNSKTCNTQGFGGGVLACTEDCKIDESGCRDSGRLTSSDEYSCSLNAQNKAQCWGLNISGRTNPPLGDFVSIVGGSRHVCAIKPDGALACWGELSGGLSVAPPGRFRAVSVGKNFACGILFDQTLTCWGNIADGRIDPPSGLYRALASGDDYTCAIDLAGEVKCWGAIPSGFSAFPDEKSTKISAATNQTCAVLEDNNAFCWGAGSLTYISFPVKGISIGEGFYCYIDQDNTVWCSGEDIDEGLIPENTDFVELAAGHDHVCGITAASEVICWGQNEHGQSSPP